VITLGSTLYYFFFLFAASRYFARAMPRPGERPTRPRQRPNRDRAPKQSRGKAAAMAPEIGKAMAVDPRRNSQALEARSTAAGPPLRRPLLPQMTTAIQGGVTRTSLMPVRKEGGPEEPKLLLNRRYNKAHFF